MNANVVTNEPVLACWTQGTGCSAIQEMMSVANRTDVISLALGLPAAELFPAREIAEAARSVLGTDPFALQYGFPFQPLKAHIVKLMAARGVTCREEQVFLTSGAQQGLSLLIRLLLNYGGEVLCEEIIYTGFQQAVEPYEPSILTVPTDLDTGIDVAAVERILDKTRPAFIYIIADGHNPMAVSLSREKRRRLVELASGYGVPIIEDDPYGFINYEDGPRELPLRALDESWVFYVGTFSKILAPALRTGWIVLPKALVPPISIIKEASDLNVCTLNQRAISAYLDAGYLTAHTEKLRRVYGERRGAMLDALEEHFPHGSRWRRPASGLFVWVELPEPLDMRLLLKTAVETEGVAFIPGQAFAINQTCGPSTSLRLNFSNSNPAQIDEAIARLARAVKRTLAERSLSVSSS